MGYRLAIDLGATSGRHVVGREEGGELILKEVYRFPTTAKRTAEYGYVWDTDAIFAHIKEGIKRAIAEYGEIESLSIDSWGVDYVLMRGEESVLPHYAYRNERTLAVIDEVHALMPFEELYKRTGIQFASINSIYALYCDLKSGRLTDVTDFLMIPEYFNYLLTGKKVKEYTAATTTGLVNARTKAFDPQIITALGLPDSIFKPLNTVGTFVGNLKDDIAKEVGGNIRVTLCASHDTACAFEAVKERDGVIISSGTWSLVGVKTKEASVTEESYKANFSNEGGVGYYRYLKNVTGMWLINELCAQLGVKVTDTVISATQSTYNRTFDVNDKSLLAPEDMRGAICVLLSDCPPVTDGDLYRSVFLSLAEGYRVAVKQIESTLGKTYDKIYIIGGGAKNGLLNDFTAAATGKQVVAMPIEATSVGNLTTQKERI